MLCKKLCLGGYKVILLNKFLKSSIYLLLCITMLTGCKDNKPEIKTEIILSNISQVEYNQISDLSKPQGDSIGDFKKLYINVKILYSKRAIDRKIIIPNIYSTIDNYDRVRTVEGGNLEQNNIGTENVAESMSYVVFDSRGLNEQEIINIYDNSEVIIGYTLKNGDKVQRKVSIGKGLIIKN